MGVEARNLDLLRRRVLNVVGHELRTPVTTLAGLASELESTTDGFVRDELIAAVARNARRLDRLVEDLLLASSVETLVPVGEPAEVDLLAVARASWDGTLPATFAGAAVARCRPTVAERALGAILDNAAAHGEPPVLVNAVVGGGVAVVEVSNGGSPVPADDLELACELFFRGEKAVTTSAGLGVGLAVARTLARADGGDVTLSPGVSGGVIARLELPAA
jgi:two-component system, OmpR family, phosphate regulon sensor histidine kinase PhoR